MSERNDLNKPPIGSEAQEIKGCAFRALAIVVVPLLNMPEIKKLLMLR
jgi:hypothetical protein